MHQAFTVSPAHLTISASMGASAVSCPTTGARNGTVDTSGRCGGVGTGGSAAPSTTMHCSCRADTPNTQKDSVLLRSAAWGGG
jgi:hypothetical protein